MMGCLTFTWQVAAIGLTAVSFSASVVDPQIFTNQEPNPIAYAQSRGEYPEFDGQLYNCFEIKRVHTLKEAKELVDQYQKITGAK